MGSRVYSVSVAVTETVTLYLDDIASLTLEVWPHLARGGTVLRHGDAGYSQALLDLPGQLVTDASERSRDGMRLVLEDWELRIDPRADEVYVEIALLRMSDQSWNCWRPGETPFEHVGAVSEDVDGSATLGPA
ncbi:hypothetical protein BW730_10730 [Tessaracoccus aquimaris]|uniref:Uncharacterized protein n=1 Tax=Tessaracoccus aquimaris TaxID=1332264 RepID=A0A1Q2CP49_9ACTN|nr:hypothetical protein BW730_10730 [Tessaracoccus aquimaris]